MCMLEEWAQQFGSVSAAANDSARAVAADASGGIFVAGEVEGLLPSADPAGLGNGDAYVRKYDGNGNLLWSQQLGTPLLDSVLALAVDAAGDPLVMGHTDGVFANDLSGSATSTYFARYSGMTGAELWRYQLPTLATKMTSDVNRSIVFVTPGNNGGTSIIKIGPTGASLFGIGVGDRKVAGLSTDREGNILITGGEGDAYVAKYDVGGNFVWERPLTLVATRDYPSSVCTDGAGNVLVAGRTSDATLESFAFVVKLNANGVVQWTHSQSSQEGVAVAADVVGNVYLLATLVETGDPSLDSADLSIFKYAADGTELRPRTTGASGSVRGEAIAVDSSGTPYVVGSTDGTLPGHTSPGGDLDAFLMRLQ
jgi:hypothetical protein